MTNVKFIARQANSVNLYKNCRYKLLSPCILVCIILYMVCMTDNKLIICVNYEPFIYSIFQNFVFQAAANRGY